MSNIIVNINIIPFNGKNFLLIIYPLMIYKMASILSVYFYYCKPK